MQLDMHFYGVYALARAVGIKPKTARLIAYASQFVDDAIDDEAIELTNGKAVLPTMTSHKPLDYQNTLPGDQWKVWIPFHFLPGNKEGAKTFVEKIVCQKDSQPAQKMLEHALKYKKESFGPHIAGIAAHVFADTFSHWGFVGLSRNWNEVKQESIKIETSHPSVKRYLWAKFETFKIRAMGSLAEAVPVGRGAVGTFPDRPYLRWEYEYERNDEYERSEKIVRNNFNDFIEACQKLHTFLKKFVEDNPNHQASESPRSWEEIEDRIRNILIKEAPLDERIEEWKKAIFSDDLFQSTDDDKKIYYSKKIWDAAHIVYHFEEKGNVDQCDACLFFKAAWIHRQFVLHELLPKVGLII